MSEEKVKDVCTIDVKKTDDPFPIILFTMQKQRIKLLVLWVKYTARTLQVTEFPNVTGTADFIDASKDAFKMNRMRKYQRKFGESFHNKTFNNKFKSKAQRKKCFEEL